MKSILVLMSLCIIVCQVSCNSHKEKTEVETRLLVTNPLKTDTSIIKEYVCQITSMRHIELRAQERGYLQDIFVDEGQFVRKGQLLFKIMPKIYEAEVKKAKAEARLAEIEYQNTKKLADNGVVAPNELAMAGAKLDMAKAELALAAVHLQFTEIKAPFDGIIDRFHLKLGSLVEEGDLLTTLSDNSKMWVYFNVPEAEYLEYKGTATENDAQKVGLLLANNRLFDYTGVVDVIAAEFNNETGNIAFRATFENPERLLRHGETGNIQIPILLKDKLIIPQKASFEVMDKKYVFVVDESDIVKARQITVGAELPDLYIIKDGLVEGEKILLEGLRKVDEGDKISYDYKAPKDVISHLKLYAE